MRDGGLPQDWAGEPAATVTATLLHARRMGEPADDRPLQDRLASEEEAYAVQDSLVRALGVVGQCAQHWKSGSPSRKEASKHSPLPSAGVLGSGSAVAVPGRCLVEAEIALRTARAVTPEEALVLTEETAESVVGSMCVSIEILASRWKGGRGAAPLLRMADLLSHGSLVLGRFVPFERRAWRLQPCNVRIGNAQPRHFRGSLGVESPLWVLPAWLRHATRNGATVPAGTLVSTGSWCGLLEAQAGESVTAEFPGIGSV
ncbi:MAG: fumarylacetoacetate hydrolase family protein, partial [Burkholderiaceae bacterium]